MKRKPSRRRCGKLQYPSERIARRAMAELRHSPHFVMRDTLRPYRCPHCPGQPWHLGNRE